MNHKQQNWMPHLVNAVPQRGYGKRLSTFTIALEGWRRGLNLEFYLSPHPENKLRIKYKLSSDKREHHFQSSFGDKVTEEAYKICDNKHLTKVYLDKLDVPYPQGEMFTECMSDKEIINYANSLGYPLVLKPTDANGGRGVFSNLKNEKSLKEALYHVRSVLGYKEVIVEEYLPGDEYRIIVIEDQVVGALNRVPANVTGNGKNTIRELIRLKNRKRKRNPHLKSRMIVIDDEVKELLYLNEYTLDTIPKDGEVITLRLTSNLSTGGDSVDLTDKLTPELKKIAINATKAIPGLNMCGIDMIVDPNSGSGKVIEVNTRPGLGGHLFPMEGVPRDIPSLIIDNYFPETKNVERSPLYFDFDAIIEPLKKRMAETVVVRQLPKGVRYSKKFTISGSFDQQKYRGWLRRTANLLYIHGSVQTIDDNTLAIIVASTDEKSINLFKEMCLKGPDNTNVIIEKIDVMEWDKPVNIGFEIKTRSQKQIRKEFKRLEKENADIQKKHDRLVKKYSKIKNSRAWRATLPVRAIIQFVKKILRFNS